MPPFHQGIHLKLLTKFKVSLFRLLRLLELIRMYCMRDLILSFSRWLLAVRIPLVYLFFTTNLKCHDHWLNFQVPLDQSLGFLNLVPLACSHGRTPIFTHTFCSLGGRGACLAVLSWVVAARSRKGDLEGTFLCLWKYSVCVDVTSLNWTKPTSPLPVQWRAVLSIYSRKLYKGSS